MEFTVRLLHLDDNARDAELIQTMLRKDGLTLDVDWVKNREDFDSALRQKKIRSRPLRR